MKRLTDIVDVNSDLQVRARSTVIDIDRDTASRLGLSIDQIRLLLYSAYGVRQVSTIYAPDDTYQVILEVDPKYADTNEVLRRMQVRTPSGGLVPLDTVAKRSDKPTSLTVNHIAQLPAVMISFNLAPGVALGEAVKSIQEVAAEVGLPAQIATSFEGSAQVFQQAVANQGMLLFAAVLVIYIILGILYENFIHPLTILSGLPSAGIGALITLMLFGMDLSVIAMIGVIMLIGIVKKNAIMMVDFALGAPRPGRAGRGGDRRCGAAALPPHHDDHDLRAARLAADRARRRRRRRAAPAAGRHRGRRPDGVAGPDAVHHAGGLYLVRPAAGREVRRDRGSSAAGATRRPRTRPNSGCWP